MVPDEVFTELAALGPNDPAALAVGQSTWLQVVPTPPIPVSVQAWNLDAGEAAVLAVALREQQTGARDKDHRIIGLPERRRRRAGKLEVGKLLLDRVADRLLGSVALALRGRELLDLVT